MIHVDWRGLLAVTALVVTGCTAWAGVDLYTHRHDFRRPLL